MYSYPNTKLRHLRPHTCERNLLQCLLQLAERKFSKMLGHSVAGVRMALAHMQGDNKEQEKTTWEYSEQLWSHAY
jgi:hypothetical protein